MSSFPAAVSRLRMPAAQVQPGPPSAQGAVVKSPEININRGPVFNVRPADGLSFDFGGSIVIPAINIGAAVYSTVFQFTVPKGYNGILNRIANVANGGGFVDFSGDLIWQIVQDLQNPGGPLVAPYYNNIQASFGGIALPSEIAGIPIKQNQVVALLVTNVAVLPAGQNIAGRFGGFFYPVSEEPPQTGMS